MLPFDIQGVLPHLTPWPILGVKANDPDGAYFQVREGYAQIVIVGVMHFTPGDYIDALNDLLDERFEAYYNAFLDPPANKEQQPMVLRRGFISLMVKKSR